jgi:hypothetical protein
VTEAEWLAANDPEAMVEFLRSRRASSRKLRLFARACCRRIWNALGDERGRTAFETAEQFADGLVERKVLTAAGKSVAAAARAAATAHPRPSRGTPPRVTLRGPLIVSWYRK